MGGPDLDGALDAFYAGDAAELERRLRADPVLVHARVASASGHYCGYFYRATLLHHVAGNPTIRELPANTPELTRIVLDAGAVVDAVTEQGPSQPDDIGWTTLGLVATSSDARLAGHQRPLLELLVARGADVDARDGGALIGALYYGEYESARWLVEHGASTDLVAAAGLGRVDLMAQHLDTPAADTLVHYAAKWPADRMLGVALVFACMAGQRDAAVWLIDRGADPVARVPFDHDATPLHWAAASGNAELVELLLARGADRTVRDRSFDSPPAGWAAHQGHEALATMLAPR